MVILNRRAATRVIILVSAIYTVNISVGGRSALNVNSQIKNHMNMPCPIEYSIKTLETHKFGLNNVDINRSYNNNFDWYRWNWFDSNNYKDNLKLNDNGSVSVFGLSGPNGQLVSAAKTSVYPYFTGKAFGGGFCVEAEISFDAHQVSPNKGFPAFWAIPLEHLNQKRGIAQALGHQEGVERFTEFDFLEAYKYQPPQYLGSIIEWYGRYRETCKMRPFCSKSYSFPVNKSTVPDSTDWNQWHRVGAVWVTSKSSGIGSIQYFFDGKAIGPKIEWKRRSKKDKLGDDSAGELYNSVDDHHLVLVFGSGKTPINVRSVTVLQRDENDNMIN